MRKTIFAETAALLKDSYFTAEDLTCDTSTAMHLFIDGKAAMFHVSPGGSCFEILLDMDMKIAEDEDRVALPESREQDETQGKDLLAGMRFLCAEDNELNAEILKEPLKMEGAECTICENGEKSLAKAIRAVKSDRGVG